MLGPEPILKFAAWETAALEIDFISAAPDLVVIRSGICARLLGFCVEFENLTSPALRCHTRPFPSALKSRSRNSVELPVGLERPPSNPTPRHESPRDKSGPRGRPHDAAGSKPKDDTRRGLRRVYALPLRILI